MPRPHLTSMSAEEHHILYSILSPTGYRIISLARTRIYHSKLGTHNWKYSGLEGILAFGRDRLKSEKTYSRRTTETNYWFRLVDVGRERRVTYTSQLTDAVDYKMGLPFWHTFRVNDRMLAFKFDVDEEGSALFREVSSRMSNKRTHIPMNWISSPVQGSFQRVAHVGTDCIDLQAANLDPKLLKNLRKHGVNDEIIQKDMQFIQGFLECAKLFMPDGVDKKHLNQIQELVNQGEKGGVRAGRKPVNYN